MMNAKAAVFTPIGKNLTPTASPKKSWTTITWYTTVKSIRQRHPRSPLLSSNKIAFLKQPNTLLPSLHRASHALRNELESRSPLVNYEADFASGESSEEYLAIRDLQDVLECSGAFKSDYKRIKRCDSVHAYEESWPQPIPCESSLRWQRVSSMGGLDISRRARRRISRAMGSESVPAWLIRDTAR